MQQQFNMPDVGEGLTEADVITWSVAVGDTVVVNQNIVEVETAKAAVELPSPFAGTVVALHAEPGETVPVGKPIITIEVPDREDAPARQPVLVGYGPRTESGGRRARKAPSHLAKLTEGADTPSANPAFNVTPDPIPAESPAARHPVLAKPPVRKLAKTLGVDLGAVEPTGPNGTVSRADVEAAATGFGTPASIGGSVRQNRETRVPIKGIRKHTAAAMVASAFTAPHVTEFITVDVTPTMELRDRLAARREFREVKLSPLVFLARAVILAAKRTPEINASWDEAAGEIVLKHYVNLGFAAATDRGLVVPNVKDADQLGLLDLTRAINALADTARAGKTTPADLVGGTITITNVGVFGVDTGTPILNRGEAGIVAFGAVRRMPWVVTRPDGSEEIVPRSVSQLAVSFDHRLVDGQQGSQFLADVAGILTDPGLALL